MLLVRRPPPQQQHKTKYTPTITTTSTKHTNLKLSFTASRRSPRSVTRVIDTLTCRSLGQASHSARTAPSARPTIPCSEMHSSSGLARASADTPVTETWCALRRPSYGRGGVVARNGEGAGARSAKTRRVRVCKIGRSLFGRYVPSGVFIRSKIADF